MAIFVAFYQALSTGCLKQVANSNLGGRSRLGSRQNWEWKDQYHDSWIDVSVKAGAAYMYRIFGAASPFGVDLGQLRGDASHEDADMWAREVRTWCRGCNMYRTSKGYFVLGPYLVREGDNICVLFGGKTPYCLRKIDDHYIFIGECYAYGLVNGEAVDMMEKGELERKYFILR